MKTKRQYNRKVSPVVLETEKHEYRIEDVPYTPKTPLLNSRYPFNELRVGTSFFVPGVEVKNISPLASLAAKASGRKFRCKTKTENGKIGTRVFRVRSHREEEIPAGAV